MTTKRKKAKARILLVEDTRTQAEEIQKHLEGMGYEVLWAKDGVSGLKVVSAESPDIVILDVILPDIDGHEVCRWIKMQGRGIPVIMLTVKGDVGDRVMGLHTGADDYLPKPFAWDELNARIYACLRTRNIQEELRYKNLQLEELLQKVEKMAVTDSLTGLYNRRRFQEAMQKEFHRCHRYKVPLTCLLIDIDHFKLVNDTYGHQTGDVVLSELGRILIKTFREIDTVSRYGGEEFAVLLPETDKRAASQAAGRLVKAVASYPFTGQETALHVTVSVGLAGIPDDSVTESDQLIQGADFALYRAKQAGRNKVEICDHFLHYKNMGAARPPSS